MLEGYEYFHKNLSEETIFNEEFFKELHRKTFSILYNFAGKYRDVNISKGYSTFCQIRFLEQTSRNIFENLSKDNFLKDFAEKSKKEFAQKIAH